VEAVVVPEMLKAFSPIDTTSDISSGLEQLAARLRSIELSRASGSVYRMRPLPRPSPAPPITMPLFPWPPSRPSTRVVIPRSVFVAYKTLGQLSYAIDQALAHTGYAERSYYAVPGGVGIITRLEHIYQDGHPFEGSTRWLLDDSSLQSFSLRSYLRALFTAREGYYRVIVFTVTDVPFGSGDGSMTSEQAASLWAEATTRCRRMSLRKSCPPVMLARASSTNSDENRARTQRSSCRVIWTPKLILLPPGYGLH
jgi:hypothetical protein